MAEENVSETKPAQGIPERPKDAAEGETGPSKSALKKAAKDKEKVNTFEC